MGLSGAKEYLVGVKLWCPPSAPQGPTGKRKVWPARENEAKEGSRQGRAVLGMRERPLTNRKGRKSAHFQAPLKFPATPSATSGMGCYVGATSALSHPTTLGRPHLRRRSCLQHDLVLQAGPSTRDLCKQQRQVSWSWLVGCDDGAPSLDAQNHAQQAGLCPSPAKAAVWAGPFDAPWGGQRASGRCAMQPPLPRAKSLSCVKKNPSLAHRTTP